MRLISAGSLVRAQSGPLHFRISISDFRFSALRFFRFAFANPTLCSCRALKALLKIENKRTAPDRLRERVLAPEMRKRMPGFEYAPVAKPGDQ